MKDLSAKRDELSELPAPPRRRTVMDYVTLAVGRAVAVVVLGFLLLIGLAYGNPRKVGPPHWTDRYVRGITNAWAVGMLIIFIYMIFKEFLKYLSK